MPRLPLLSGTRIVVASAPAEARILRPPPPGRATDVVVVVSAAETVLHGGPATLLAAADAETQRRATAGSLLETRGSEGWRLASLVERTLAARVPLFGLSLVLNHPQFTGLLRGYPYEPAAAERIARSPLRVAFNAAPEAVRLSVLRSLRGTRTASAL